MTYPIPKSDWGDGPWQSEPDHLEWRFRELPCVIHRNVIGAWCGYVAVPKGHPWHGKDADALPAEAHGGLTYAGTRSPGRAAPKDSWWLGFDCGHWDDYVPCIIHLGGGHRHGTYRDQAWVSAETERLALQAIEKGKG